MEAEAIFKIAGVGLLTAMINIILKKSDKDEIATFVTLAGLVIVLTVVLDMVVDLFDSVRGLFNLF